MGKDYIDYLSDADDEEERERRESIGKRRREYEQERSFIERFGDALGLTDTVGDRMRRDDK